MLNIDVGGQKGKNTVKGTWQILDITEDADYVHNLNSGDPLPFDDNVVDNIYTSATLEHVEPRYIQFVLDEFCRVLKPGGKCRIAVPDCRHGIELYLNNPEALSKKPYGGKHTDLPNTPMAYLTNWFASWKVVAGNNIGHKIGFDEELLRAFLDRTEFKNIKKMEYNARSEIFHRKDYERYARWFLYFEMEA